MNYFFIALFTCLFVYFNTRIIISDIKYKIIPNKFLGYLLILIIPYYLYLLFYQDLLIINILVQFIISTFLSFILYYFWVWSAWDAKYLLVLSLFLANVWIITFAWNIALITLIYLILYYFWFYIGKCLFNHKYAVSLYGNIKKDLEDKWNIFKIKKKGNTQTIIIKWLIIFLLFFVSFRITRLYLINNILNTNNSNFIMEFIMKYHIYSLVFFSITFILILFIIKTIFKYLILIIKENTNINFKKTTTLFYYLIFFILIAFIAYEYSIDKATLLNSLYKIFTTYIILYILIKIFIYSYNVTFQVWEESYININELKEWDFVDKKYLIQLLWTQNCLWYSGEKKLLSPSPINYFKNLENPINQEDVIILKKAYEIVNKKIKEKENSNPIKNIKILKTFSFGIYIFTWFFITLFYSDKLLKLIFEFITNYFLSLAS